MTARFRICIQMKRLNYCDEEHWSFDQLIFLVTFLFKEIAKQSSKLLEHNYY